MQPGVLCALSDGEVRQLYATHAVLTPSDEIQLAVPQPSRAKVVSSADFRVLAAEQAGADSRAESHRPDLWSDGAAEGYASAQLQQLHQRVCAAARVLVEDDKWLREVLLAGWMGGDHRGTWEDLLEVADSLAVEAAAAIRLERTYGPELPDGRPFAEVAAIFAEVVAHLESGHSLGLKTKLTHREWHRMIETCRVEGRAPQTLDEFRALFALAQLHESRSRFAARWRRSVESFDGPTLESSGQFPERAAQSYAPQDPSIGWNGGRLFGIP